MLGAGGSCALWSCPLIFAIFQGYLAQLLAIPSHKFEASPWWGSEPLNPMPTNAKMLALKVRNKVSSMCPGQVSGQAGRWFQTETQRSLKTTSGCSLLQQTTYTVDDGQTMIIQCRSGIGWNPASNSEGTEGFFVREVQGRRGPLSGTPVADRFPKYTLAVAAANTGLGSSSAHLHSTCPP